MFDDWASLPLPKYFSMIQWVRVSSPPFVSGLLSVSTRVEEFWHIAQKVSGLESFEIDRTIMSKGMVFSLNVCDSLVHK